MGVPDVPEGWGASAGGWLTQGLSADPCQCSRLSPKNRVNCGFPGITSDQCFSAGCCFDSSIPGVPWCFKPLPKQGNVQESWDPLLCPGWQPRTWLLRAPTPPGPAPGKGKRAPTPMSTLDPKGQPPFALLGRLVGILLTVFEGKTTLRPLFVVAPEEASKGHEH